MANNFIITTDDIIALNKKIDDIKQSLNYTLDSINYNLDDESIYDLIDDLNTVSLFNEDKFIIVKNAETIINLKNENIFNEFLKALNDQYSNNTLILVFQDFVDYNNPKFQKIKSFCISYDVKVKNIDFTEYVNDYLKKYEIKIDDGALSMLLSYNESLMSLTNSLEQLVCFKYDEKLITCDDVLKIVSKPLEDNVYNLIEAVLENDKVLMLKTYKDLKFNNLNATNLLSMLLKKFQELYDVSVLSKSKISQATIAQLFNVSSGRAYYMINNAKKYSISTLKKQLSKLNKLEIDIKSGLIDAELGMELFFLS